MISNDIDAKSFLIKNYLILFFGTVTATVILGASISTMQMRSVHDLYLERLNKVIILHKNELLNEIALEDNAALAQHLEIIRSELAIDSISLETKNFKFNNYDQKIQDVDTIFMISKFLFFRAIGVKSLIVPVSNDFDNINAILTVIYEKNFSEWVLGPFIRVSIFIFALALLPVGFIFLGLFRKIDQLLISPLRRVTASFQEADCSGISGITENALGEIKALAVASEKLRTFERTMAFSELAQQVSHDIRSPLSALNMVVGILDGVQDEKRVLIRNAVQRINDIANSLLQKSKDVGRNVKTEFSSSQQIGNSASFPIQTTLLSALVDTLVSEKRIQFRERIGVDISLDLRESYGLL